MNSLTRLLVCAALSLTLTACATGSNNAGEMEIRSGKIEQIYPAQITSSHHTGLGAIAGGLGGLALGSLIGKGTGRDVAMAAGAIGGAMVGNEVQKKNDQPIPAQQIIVRTSSGVLVAITQPLGQPLFVGQRVYIQGNGESAVVTPQ